MRATWRYVERASSERLGPMEHSNNAKFFPYTYANQFTMSGPHTNGVRAIGSQAWLVFSSRAAPDLCWQDLLRSASDVAP